MSLVMIAGLSSLLAAKAWAQDEPLKTEIDWPANTPLFNPKAPLQEFYISATALNRYAVDPGSIRRIDDNLIHFTTVITSPSGVRNVSSLGFRCSKSERRTVAIVRSDGTWQPLQQAWRPVGSGGELNHAERVLISAFCLGGSSVSDSRQAIRALAATFNETRY
jgi:hypothetical protein